MPVSVLYVNVDFSEISICHHECEVDCLYSLIRIFFAFIFYISIKQSVLLGCSNQKFELLPATGSAVNNGVITITVNQAIAGMDKDDITDLAEALLPSAIDSYTFTMVVLPELAAVGYGQWPGTYTWYRTGYAQYAELGVHEIGTRFCCHPSPLLSSLFVQVSFCFL